MAINTFPTSGGGGLEPKYQKFTSSGTFTLPEGYGAAKPLLVNIQIIGGGGGGSADVVNSMNADYNGYFGNGSFNSGTINGVGRAGGSGGIAATQMYLTSNLTITVGAAGTRLTAAVNGNNSSPTGDSTNTSNLATAGSGGTTTAGSVQATGGVGANQRASSSFGRYGFNGNTTLSTVGAGGTPAGTAGSATPLLGTIAGGSIDSTPIRGSFGIGGISTDGATTTGVEGTGGGMSSVGASGAVILTWWQ